MHRMVSIDLNTPTPSLTSVYQSKGSSLGNKSITRKSRMKSANDETQIYDKYFHTRIAKPVSIVQLILSVLVLICQLSTTGLLIGPITSASGSALSTSDRIGLGIWTSIATTLAVGATFWAINKTNFCRLHTAMLLHFVSLIAYIVLECLLLVNTIPLIQDRIYFLQKNMSEITTSTLDTRRLLLIAKSLESDAELKKKAQIQMQAELHRLYAALVLSIIMALGGIFQILFHFLMNLKTGRAICLGKTYFEGKLLRMQSFGSAWRNKSFRLGSKESTLNLPKLERSDTLPPPPYESGYFHPSLSA